MARRGTRARPQGRTATGRVGIATIATIAVVLLVVGGGAVWRVRTSAYDRLHRSWRRLEARAARYGPPAGFEPVRTERSGMPCLALSGCASPALRLTFTTSLSSNDACARLDASLRALSDVSRVRRRGENRDARGLPDRYCAIDARTPEGGVGAGVFPPSTSTGHERAGDALAVSVSFIRRA